MADKQTREGEVPDYPASNPRNAFDEEGAPRNPAVHHPLPSQGFPDNDGDMAHRPTHQVADHPDGNTYLIKHAGVLKGADVPDEELPPEQQSDLSYREKYERDNPTAKVDDITEPKGQPVDKYGFFLREGADPDAQSTGDDNPDNPDQLTKSDRYLGEEEPGNAQVSANDGAGFPAQTDLPSPRVDPFAGEGELLENLTQPQVEGLYKQAGQHEGEVPVEDVEGVRVHSVKVILPDGDLDVNEDGIPDIDPTPPDPEAPIDARSSRNRRPVRSRSEP